MKIFVTGVSGTGKTSIANALKARGINAVDIDDLCHWEDKHSGEVSDWKPGADKEWHDSNVWLCNIDKLKKILSNTHHAVALGHSTNQEDYLSLFDKIYILSCRPETIISRIKQRTNNDYGKHSNEQKLILNWQKKYEPEMVSKGAIPLDVERPLKEVVDDIVTNFD